MKQIYLTINLILISAISFAQGYEYSVVENSAYNFSIVATPDFTSSGNTDISDLNFSIMLPTGNFEATNLTQFYGRSWSINASATGPIMQTNLGLGDGTKDLVVFTLPPAQTLLSHNNSDAITLVTFDITNSPSSGAVELLDNSDPIAVAFAGAADSIYNSNIDSTSTEDYFSGITSGSGSQTLSIDDITFEESQVSIYPNPTRGNLTIETNKSISYSIYNILGQSVKLHGKLESSSRKSISLSHLPDGIYILKAEDENNNSKSFKIIKKE